MPAVRHSAKCSFVECLWSGTRRTGVFAECPIGPIRTRQPATEPSLPHTHTRTPPCPARSPAGAPQPQPLPTPAAAVAPCPRRAPPAEAAAPPRVASSPTLARQRRRMEEGRRRRRGGGEEEARRRRGFLPLVLPAPAASHGLEREQQHGESGISSLLLSPDRASYRPTLAGPFSFAFPYHLSWDLTGS